MSATPDLDPTRIDILFDPRAQRMRGRAIHGDTDFDVPYISHIVGNLYTGGCRNGLQLPVEIVNVLSLYKWESYTYHDFVKNVHVETMYDSAAMMPVKRIIELADILAAFTAEGPTLDHCQAGLNRSGLIAAAYLIRHEGYTAAQAISLLRERRHPAVLCNQTFARWLLMNGDEALTRHGGVV